MPEENRMQAQLAGMAIVIALMIGISMGGLSALAEVAAPKNDLAALEADVLNRVLALPLIPPEPEPLSPLPTQLRWAL